ncbi:MAG: glucose 1-dehydrogenase [Coriobacteriia bacterium]|nr:glucose 1-dehydrogenase [Coriobacteriia bacterium]
MGERLKDKVALVTGSDSGIGRATAIEFARDGADVVVTYFHDADGARETAAAVEGAGRRAMVVRLDVREESSVEAMFDRAMREFGHVDILVNNAGVDASGKRVHELDTETWDNAMRTNLYGYFFCARRFVRERLKAGGGGRIVNVTSIHSEHPRAGAADYDCSKAGEEELGDTLAIELAQDGINVVNVAPGWVLTPFNEPDIVDPERYERDARTVPVRRAAMPEEIAKAIIFVVSPDADYMTGTTMTIDGGLSVNQGQGA